jgi:hypothetical protein
MVAGCFFKTHAASGDVLLTVKKFGVRYLKLLAPTISQTILSCLRVWIITLLARETTGVETDYHLMSSSPDDIVLGIILFFICT